MADVFAPAQRSSIISRMRSRGDLATGLRFIRVRRHYGISGWRRGSKLPGRPDFIFPKRRLAVFIDGDFWHGNPRKYRCPRTNCDYWRAKIQRNRERDREVSRLLRKRRWKVV